MKIPQKIFIQLIAFGFSALVPLNSQDLVKTKFTTESEIATDEENYFLAEGKLKVSAQWNKTISNIFEVASDDEYRIRLSEVSVKWENDVFTGSLGFMRFDLGSGDFVSKSKRVSPKRSLDSRLADKYTFIGRGLGIRILADASSFDLPIMNRIALWTEDQNILPRFLNTSVVKLGSDFRLLGFGVAIMPLEILNPDNTRRIDFHGMAGIFYNDHVEDFLLSLNASVGTIPDKTPWAFPTFVPQETKVWMGSEASIGYRLAVGDWKIIPGTLLLYNLDDLSTPGNYSLKALGGVKILPLKELVLWSWAGLDYNHSEQSARVVWDIGASLEL